MRLKLNRDYARRHAFVAVLLAGLSIWFAYDGFVRYPATPAAELYRAIERSDPPDGYDLEGFKRQKTQTQHGFALLALLAALAVGLDLWLVSRLAVEHDASGFSYGGRRYGWADVKSVDRRRWQTKGIAVLSLADGRRLKLDAWHHAGVKEMVAQLA